ncbi:MAG: CPBP family intramembrane metalloprotease [Dehalococcoidia bacterium]|nr:MAG: CPBP family intramembrane metalloprotease [Dehalococcoidia bacterium]
MSQESISTISGQKLPLKIGKLEKVIGGVYLVLIACAEAATIYNPISGITFHIGIFFALLINSIVIKKSAFSGLLLALAIAPLIRILSLAMPLTHFGYMMWFLLISIPIFIAILACMMIQRLSLKDVGIALPKAKDIPIEFGVVLLALPIGILEYKLLTPAPLLYSLEPSFLVAPVLIMVIYTGFVEELAFRGLMQYHALKTMGWWGILFVSLIFAIMHIGNLVLWDVLLAFSLGGIYALVVKKTGSLYGVSLSHGVVNIILFLIAPLYF